MSATELSEQLSRKFKVYKIDYLEGSLNDIKRVLSEINILKDIDLDSLVSFENKMAFWLNVYNSVTNYLIIKRNIKTSMKSDLLVFVKPKVNIAGLEYSLDDIEHGIIRNNHPALYKLWRQFSRNDSRVKYVIDKLDYRIHFALNCGAISCPPIAFYSSDKIEQQLALAEKSFVEQQFVVDNENQSIDCSMLFKMYKKDFGNNYLNDHKYKKYKVHFRDYDWSVSA